MFTVIFAFAFVTTSYVTAERPPYIHVCNRNNSKFDQCILENIYNLRNKVCEGIPELDITPLNSYFIDNLIISDTSNSKMVLRDVQVTGHCDAIIKHGRIDLDELHFDAELFYKLLQANATYDFDIRLLVPITLNGPVCITSNNVGMKINLDLKVVTKSGKRYVYVSKMKANIEMKEFDADSELADTELNQINLIISSFVGRNQKEIINVLKPLLEENFVKYSIMVINTLLKQYTYEELFPDRV